MLDLLYTLHRVSTPLVVIQVHDHLETLNRIYGFYAERENGTTIGANIYEWSFSGGLRCVRGTAIPDTGVGSPAQALSAFYSAASKGSMLLMHPLGARILDDPMVYSAITNCRQMKDNRMIAFLEYNEKIPVKLLPHLIVLHDTLPTSQELKHFVAKYFKQYCNDEETEQNNKIIIKAAEILQGVSEFTAEQIIVSSISKKTKNFNFKRMWQMKCDHIASIPGLSISLEDITFKDIGGLENVKTFFSHLLDRKQNANAPNVVIWLDEIEKMVAGSEGPRADNTGINQGILQTLLVYMQENDIRGAIFLGPPGTGKSLAAKALGGEGKLPTIYFDIGAMKSSLVGSTEQNVRRALDTIDAISKRKQLWIATCNSLSSVPAALRRRFTYGLWFFDLPTKEERSKIWSYYLNKLNLSEEPLQSATPWTGAEIRTCCQLSAELGISLKEASKYVIPVVNSMGDQLLNLREEAKGRYLSASHTGTYKPTELIRNLEE